MPSSHSFLISNHMLLWLLTLVVGCIDFKGWIVKAIEEMLSIHKWNLIKSLDGATKSAYYCCLLREGVQNKTLGRSLPNLTHPRWGGFWEVWTLFGNQPPHPPTFGKSPQKMVLDAFPKCQIGLVTTQQLDIQWLEWWILHWLIKNYLIWSPQDMCINI